MRRTSFGLAALVLAPASALAQGTRAEYARADSLAARARGKIVNAVTQANWIGGTAYVWYRKTTPTGTAYTLTSSRRPF